MKVKGTCSQERLELALTGSLCAEEESTLHLHLETCQACCAKMEQLVGGESLSNEIAFLLVPDEWDEVMPPREEWSTADFVVEYLAPSSDGAVLGILGSYDIVDIIGRGGMGIVLKAYDRELKRFVAIKALAPHLAHSALARKRFEREAQAAAAVVSPHVIAIHQVQSGGPLPFLVMPLLTGESLAQRIKTRGPLELKEILRIGMQAATGLAEAHDQGLIHRDVKPANILLESGVERAVLTDFGLARAADDVSMTQWGIIAGTPEYMSPEQARGELLDGRSDLFSLGCVLYEMATGVSPFRADSTMATLRRIVDEKPVAMASMTPDLPPWFIEIVERLLSKNPALRFASAREVSTLLEQCLSHVQQPASSPLPSALTLRRAKRSSFFTLSRRKIFGLLGLVGLIVLMGAFFLEAPDIAGRWVGSELGAVKFESSSPGQYQGKLTGARPDKVGFVNVKWSRLERRFNGTWSDGNRSIGKISLRVVDGELHGAFTTSKDSPKAAEFPRLSEVVWTREEAAGSVPSTIPVEKQATFLKDPEAAKANIAASPKFDDRVFAFLEEPLSATILDHDIASQEIVLGVGALDEIQIGHAFTIFIPGTDQCIGVAKVMELESHRCVAKVMSIGRDKTVQPRKGFIAVCQRPKLDANKIVVECGLGKRWPIESLENAVIRKMLERGGDRVQILVRRESSGHFVYRVDPAPAPMGTGPIAGDVPEAAMTRYALRKRFRALDSAELVANALPELGMKSSLVVVADEQQNTISIGGDDASQKILFEQLRRLDPGVKKAP